MLRNGGRNGCEMGGRNGAKYAVRRMQPIPEPKIVFTVKVPLRLVRALRQMARSTGESLSALVTRALEAFLQNRGGHG